MSAAGAGVVVGGDDDFTATAWRLHFMSARGASPFDARLSPLGIEICEEASGNPPGVSALAAVVRVMLHVNSHKFPPQTRQRCSPLDVLKWFSVAPPRPAGVLSKMVE